MDVLAKLGIDWKLLLAQAVNFLLLLYILKRYAYRPILKLLDERSRKIEKGLADAEAAEKRLAASLEEEKKVLALAREEARKTLERAETSAKKRDGEMLEVTKVKIDKMIAEADAHLNDEKQKLILEAKSEIAELVLLSLEKVLREKVNPDTDRALIEKTLQGMGK